MSIENDLENTHSRHPEIVNNPLEVQHAQQVTLRHLLASITDITIHSTDFSGSKSADLQFADSGEDAIAVMRHTSPRDSNRPATLHSVEKVGNGDRIMTNYSILDSPDGLHIEKHRIVANVNRHKGFVGLSAAEKEIASAELVAQIAAERQAVAEEDALGLSFVSEQETRDLLNLLDKTIIKPGTEVIT